MDRSLKKDPNQRWQTAAEFREALVAHQGNRGNTVSAAVRQLTRDSFPQRVPRLLLTHGAVVSGEGKFDPMSVLNSVTGWMVDGMPRVRVCRLLTTFCLRDCLQYNTQIDNPDPVKASFLLVDLGLANTFLNVARTAKLEKTRKRNITNAWKAHDAVTRLASRVRLTDSEAIGITEGLRALRKRLEAHG